MPASKEPVHLLEGYSPKCLEGVRLLKKSPPDLTYGLEPGYWAQNIQKRRSQRPNRG
jgi:hypothetical protein